MIILFFIVSLLLETCKMALSQGTYVYYDLKGDGRIQMSLITVGEKSSSFLP